MLPLILIVDDKPEIAKVIAMFLTSSYRSKTYTSGHEAIDALKTSNELPSLIISDVRMPDMDGYEFIRALKNNHLTEPIPIMVLSSIESSADKIRLLEMGAADFVLKPFNPEELKLRIGQLLLKK